MLPDFVRGWPRRKRESNQTPGLVGPGVVPQHSDFNNLQCQTSLTALTGAKGAFPRCQTGKA
jgi:hypothetical protein